ncbi:MAG: DEAD/DEAH box helicase family protein [Oscillospiraceae bacterium]|nr:DEAD/DEAH box helicase family protein [Oscillospiraceae bacterium]
MSLPEKDIDYGYPRDVQSDVWEKWFDVRTQKNTIIKMNTGSGKTVVGLMILQSCLNEGIGPAIYVVPDKYLVQQVINEAKKLGIKVTKNRDDYYYSNNKAILIMPIHALVNGRSVFGMRKSDNYPIGSIIIDDVHACIDTISDQFTLKVPYEQSLYKDLKNLLNTSLANYDSCTVFEVFDKKSPGSRMLVPFWIWKEKENEIFTLLQQYDNEENENIFFHLSLLRDCFSTCNCIITPRGIEISPKGNDISLIKSFQNAERRIFMSATLADDSVFVSTLGLQKMNIKNIIVPDSAEDIGARLILFPKHLNNSIMDEDIRTKVTEISSKYNVVVIVPSFERSKFWGEFATFIVNKDNILDAVEKMKQSHVGLVVFVNRYDGIDLPNDACHLLVIDSLPPPSKEYNKYVHSICVDSKLIVRERMQRIEQGMGRGVRSNNDSCCIVFMGSNLADVLIRQHGYRFFSNATQKQYELSENLWDVLKGEKSNPTIDDIFSLADYSLKRNPGWISQCKEFLASVTYSTEPCIDSTDIALRNAFEQYMSRQYQQAAGELISVINESEGYVKGYLMQIKAEYTNLTDPVSAQQILLAAKKYNRSVLNPIEGIQHQRVFNKDKQAKNILQYIKTEYSDSNCLIVHLQKILDDLSFESEANTFENALEQVGRFLGFVSTRPDHEENDGGTDNLWALGDNTYWVIECKNEAVANTISKSYCNQLDGSIRWFKKVYGLEYAVLPVLVHRSKKIDRIATRVDGMRVITELELNKLKVNIQSFYNALVKQPDIDNENHIQELLNHHRLNRGSLKQSFTVDCS